MQAETSAHTASAVTVNAEQFLTFMLNGEEYGVDILRVQEIKGWESATEIPNTPQYIRGVINLRGTIVPVIDLRERLASQLGEWQGEMLPIDRVFLGSVFFREALASRYPLGDGTVDLFLGVGYRAQRYGSPLSPKTELLEDGWVVEERWPLAAEPGHARG